RSFRGAALEASTKKGDPLQGPLSRSRRTRLRSAEERRVAAFGLEHWRCNRRLRDRRRARRARRQLITTRQDLDVLARQRLALDVAFWMSLAAPVGTRSYPKMSSSATRPPYDITRFASSCWRVIETRSSSGSVNARPSARPRGTIVTLCSGSLPLTRMAQIA